MSNIVRAVFGGSKTTRTRRLWQFDRGMLLQFVDLNLPTAYQVHFANSPTSGQAKVVTATSDTVEILDEYLQIGADVYAWIYLTPESGVGYTKYMVTIPVYARSDYTDEEPVPAQQSALDTAISALNSGVESVQAAVAGVQDSIDAALQEAKDSGEFDGADGYSPAATVTQTETGASISITDTEGTTTANIRNGQDGAPGAPGSPGNDGVANVPIASASVYGVIRSGSVSVSGTTPTINALSGIRYICGEVTTIDIVTPASGIIDVVFTSGSTPAVLTVTPPTGMTMKWANGFDPDNLEADTTYEINIADGCLGVAGSWS